MQKSTQRSDGLSAAVTDCQRLHRLIAEAGNSRGGDVKDSKRLAQCIGWMKIISAHSTEIAVLEPGQLSNLLNLCREIRSHIAGQLTVSSIAQQEAVRMCDLVLDQLLQTRHRAQCATIGINQHARSTEDAASRTSSSNSSNRRIRSNSSALPVVSNDCHFLGVTFAPKSLTTAAEVQLNFGTDLARILHEAGTAPQWQRERRWHEVPQSWLFDFVDRKNLQPFSVRESTERIVLPLAEDGKSIIQSGVDKYVDFIRATFQQYNKGKNRTLQTPFDRAMYPKGLHMQLDLIRQSRARNLVIHNLQGKRIFAAISRPTIVTNTCCYFVTDSENEARFIAGLLNSEVYVKKHLGANTSKKRYYPFHKYNVVMPRYDVNNEEHRLLVESVEQAEQFVQQLPCSENRPSQSQCNVIRNRLRSDGVMARIDQCVRAVLE